MLGAKDWLFWRLTGDYATDPSTASGFGCYGLASGAWLDDVVAGGRPSGAGVWPIADEARAPVPAALTTSPLRHDRPLSRGRAGSACLTVFPVCLGGADSVLGCLGLG